MKFKRMKWKLAAFMLMLPILAGCSEGQATDKESGTSINQIESSTTDTASSPSVTTESAAPSNSEIGATEVIESSEIESTEFVESSTPEATPSTEAEDMKYIDEDVVISLIEDLAAKYPKIDKKQFVAIIVIANLDHITEESYDEIINTYKLSSKQLNDQFIKFVETYNAGVYDTARYYMDDPNANEKAYEELPKFVEFAMTDEDREMAVDYDENAFAANATPNYGQQVVGNAYTYSDFEDTTSFEVACKRVQYFIVDGIHPEQFNSFEAEFTK